MNLTFNNEVQRVLGTYRTPSLEKLILPESQPVAQGKNIDPKGRPCTWSKSRLILPEARIRYDRFEIIDNGFVLEDETLLVSLVNADMSLGIGVNEHDEITVYNVFNGAQVDRDMEKLHGCSYLLFKDRFLNTFDKCIETYQELIGVQKE